MYVAGKSWMVGDVSVNSRLFVGSDVSLGGNMYVAGKSWMAGDVSMNSRLFISSDVSMGGNMYVAAKSWMVSDVSMNSRLFVGSDVSMGGNMYIAGKSWMVSDVSINSRIFVGSDVSMGGNMYVAGKSWIVGDVSMNSRLFIGSDVSIAGNMYVFGNSLITEDVSISKRLNVNGNISTNNFVFSNGYDTNSGNVIYIGNPNENRVINIGHNLTADSNVQNQIYIGNVNDTIHFVGSTVLSTTSLDTKTIILNASGDINSSQGSGIYVHDNNQNNAGFFLISQDRNAFLFKAPGSSNIVRFDNNKIAVPNVSPTPNAGILLVEPSTKSIDSSANYTISTSQNIYFDSNNNFNSTNSAIFQSDVNVNGNLYSNGNTILKNTSISNTMNNQYALEIYGYTNTNSNPIFQF
jgi:predicted acyltransferase (DUF342 family)